MPKISVFSRSDVGIVVSIAAFQAVDPGSIPGHRKSFGRILPRFFSPEKPSHFTISCLHYNGRQGARACLVYAWAGNPYGRMNRRR